MRRSCCEIPWSAAAAASFGQMEYYRTVRVVSRYVLVITRQREALGYLFIHYIKIHEFIKLIC